MWVCTCKGVHWCGCVHVRVCTGVGCVHVRVCTSVGCVPVRVCTSVVCGCALVWVCTLVWRINFATASNDII